MAIVLVRDCARLFYPPFSSNHQSRERNMASVRLRAVDGAVWNKIRILQCGCNFKRYHNNMIFSAGEMCSRGRRNLHLKKSKQQKKYSFTVQRRKRTTCRLLILQVHPADRDEQSLSTTNLNAEHEPRTTTTTNGGLARRNKRASQGMRLRGEGRRTPFDSVVVST